MYILKNSLKNILVFKTRNILVFIVVILLSTLSCTAMIVLQASQKYEEENASRMVLSLNLGEANVERKSLSISSINSLSELSYISILYEGFGTAITFDTLNTIEYESKESLQRFREVDSSTPAYDIVGTHLAGGGDFKSYILSNNPIYEAYTKSRVATAFSNQQLLNIIGQDPEEFFSKLNSNNSLSVKFRLSDGIMYSNDTLDYECIIDTQLAESHYLNLGDVIQIYSKNREFNVKITGIYYTAFITRHMTREQGAFEIEETPDPRGLFDTESYESFYLPSVYVNDSFYNEIILDDPYGLPIDFNVLGFPTDDSLKDFVVGTKSIAIGRVFDPNNEAYECIISDELARRNNVTIGDNIVLRGIIDESKEYYVKIVGIFLDSQHGTISDKRFEYNDATRLYTSNVLKVPLDTIYMSYSALTKILDDIDMYASVPYKRVANLRLVFSGSEDMNDYYTKLIRKYYKDGKQFSNATADSKAYFNQLTTIKRTTTFAMATFIIVLLIAVFFLFTYNSYNMRERQYEIGVLTSMGVSKAGIVVQFFSEIIIVVITAAFIGTILGSFTSSPVGNYFTKQKNEGIVAQQNAAIENFGRDVNIPYLESNDNQPISASLSTNMTLMIMGAFGAVTLASISNTASIIVKFEPINILSSR